MSDQFLTMIHTQYTLYLIDGVLTVVSVLSLNMHDVVSNSENFVHPVHQEIHTQNIENLWSCVKRKFKIQYETDRSLFVSYLEEFQ